MTEQQYKTCTKCNETKPYDMFNIDRKNVTSGRKAGCKKCNYEQEKKYRLKNRRKRCEASSKYYQLHKDQRRKYVDERRDLYREHRRKSMLKLKYGINPAIYEKLRSDQSGLCKICGRPETTIDRRSERVRSLNVDHNHSSGRVRGLLCRECNLLLGHGRDDADVIGAAALYVRTDGTMVEMSK